MELALDVQHRDRDFYDFFFRNIVSILVFVELALDDDGFIVRRTYYRVSILVFVELALDGRRGSEWEVDEIVSILVFVELALDGQFVYEMFLDSSGFNPCFRGTCS